MAIAADLSPPVRLREPGVIKRCTRPTRRRVASRAGGWEAGGCMVRVRSVLVINLVAPVAVGWKRRVVTVDVTIDALTRWHGMRPS